MPFGNYFVRLTNPQCFTFTHTKRIQGYSPLKRTLRPSICLSVDSMFAKLIDSPWTISFRLNETLTSSAQIQSTIIFQNFCHVKVFIFRKHLSFHCFDQTAWGPINHRLQKIRQTKFEHSLLLPPIRDFGRMMRCVRR